MKKGKLYGVGIGPGDPELLTVKALRVIREADAIVCPGKVARDTVAYQIVVRAYPDLDKKEILAVDMPMTKDAKKLAASHRLAVETVERALDEGKNIAFLTLGDPTIYSTYIYVHKPVTADGYETEIISGIPSFCAVAARLNMGLVEKAEPLHISPASYGVDEILKLEGTKVMMKSGKQMQKVKESLLSSGQDVKMIENCGMPEERIYQSAEEIPETAGYYSLIIAKGGSR